MALKLTPPTTSPRMTLRTIDPPTDSWRLPSHHLVTLRDVARGLEETNAGVRTRYLLEEAIDRGAIGSDDDPSLLDVERLMDRFAVWADAHSRTWMQKVRRCRRALASLAEAGMHKAVGTLHVVYGYPDPITRGWPDNALRLLGELASLVRYTDAVEERRRRMVRAEMMKPPPSGWTDFALREFANARWQKSAKPMWQGLPSRGNPTDLVEPMKLVDLSRYRDREAYLEKTITSADALRAAMAPFPEDKPKKRPGESKPAYIERCKPHEDRANTHHMRRVEFLSEARRDADAMLSEASRRYHEAWRATPP